LKRFFHNPCPAHEIPDLLCAILSGPNDLFFSPGEFVGVEMRLVFSARLAENAATGDKLFTAIGIVPTVSSFAVKLSLKIGGSASKFFQTKIIF
jgi:hypothetical protein